MVDVRILLFLKKILPKLINEENELKFRSNLKSISKKWQILTINLTKQKMFTEKIKTDHDVNPP